MDAASSAPLFNDAPNYHHPSLAKHGTCNQGPKTLRPRLEKHLPLSPITELKASSSTMANYLVPGLNLPGPYPPTTLQKILTSTRAVNMTPLLDAGPISIELK